MHVACLSRVHITPIICMFAVCFACYATVLFYLIFVCYLFGSVLIVIFGVCFCVCCCQRIFLQFVSFCFVMGQGGSNFLTCITSSRDMCEPYLFINTDIPDGA